jgi:ribonuclease P protein component
MRRAPDFVCAMRSGRRAGRRTLVVHLGTVDGSTEPVRVGFVVSRAVGGAVVRNRVKRRLRAHMNERLQDLRGGALVVVRALPAAGHASFATLATDLDAALGSVLRAGGARS